MDEQKSDQLPIAAGPEEIVRAYRDAATAKFARSEVDAGYFFLTHAFIHALEAGLADAEELEQRLKDAHRL